MNALRKLVVGIIGITAMVAWTLTYAWNFQNVIFETIKGDATAGKTLQDIMQPYTLVGKWDENVRDFLVFVAIKILLPMAVLIGVIIAILWFYKLMSATSADEESKWINFLLWWTVGVIVMVSAWYFTNQLVGELGNTGIIWQYEAGGNPTGGLLASEIYDKLFFPVVKLFIYLVLGILFISAVISWFRYIFSNDESAQKKALSIILFNALGMIVIIVAKSMVESVYGTYQEATTQNIDNLGDVGAGVFEAPQFAQGDPIPTVINWVLGLATFFVLLIILYQGYMLLTNPTNEDTIKKLKKNIVYVLIGILVIGAGYLLTNFFIVN